MDTRIHINKRDYDKLHQAINDAIEQLGAWLTDHTDEVFEEQPEIDNIRAALIEVLNSPYSAPTTES